MPAPNKYKDYCFTCSKLVLPKCGFVVKKDDMNLVYCKEHVPPDALERVLTKEGIIKMPYEEAALPLLRLFPGSLYNSADQTWQVSLAMEDRKQVLYLADQLKLKVAEELRKLP